MPRFYADIALQTGTQLNLPDAVFHHWIKVLRARIGDQAVLFNGQGGEYTVVLSNIEKKYASVLITQFDADDRIPAYQVVLGQVMSKGDRMDYAIQKATELGVHTIQLLISERCEMRLKYERDQKKLDHWQQIAIAACEQCGMNRIPKIQPPVLLEDWLKQPDAMSACKLMLAPAQQAIQFKAPFPQHFRLIVGPEGGFSDDEMHMAHTYGYAHWTLGNRILRTETAPVVALSALLWASNALV